MHSDGVKSLFQKCIQSLQSHLNIESLFWYQVYETVTILSSQEKTITTTTTHNSKSRRSYVPIPASNCSLKQKQLFRFWKRKVFKNVLRTYLFMRLNVVLNDPARLPGCTVIIIYIFICVCVCVRCVWWRKYVARMPFL